MLCLVTQSCPTRCDPRDQNSPGSSVHRDSSGKNTGVGCHALLQGIFPAQVSKQGLLHCRRILYQLSYQGSQYICILTADLIPGLGRSPGGGNGNPFQYSCLENPMGRGPGGATVHGVANSLIQPSMRVAQADSWFTPSYSRDLRLRRHGKAVILHLKKERNGRLNKNKSKNQDWLKKKR